MIIVARAALAASAMFVASLAPAYAQTADVAGWWRADLTHNGETQPMYLHFGEREGRPIVRFSIPVVRMHEVYVGPYEVDAQEVRLPGLGWRLRRNGEAIDGVVPPGMVTVYEINARFARSEPAPAPPDIAPAQAAPAPVWSVNVGAEVFAGVLHDAHRRTLYVAAEDGRVHALDTATGATRWTQTLGAPIRATPTLHANRLFVASDTALTAFDARTGRQIWAVSFNAERAPRLPMSDPNSRSDYYSASAAVDGQFASVAARDGCVYALNAGTGAQRWRTCVEQDILTSTPALTRDAVYISGFDHHGYALRRSDGAMLWRHDLSGAAPRDPVVAGENVIFGSRSYELIAVNAASGERAWTRYFWFSWVDSPPVLAGGALYVGASDALAIQAFDATTGVRRWSAAVPGWSRARPAVGRDIVVASVTGGLPYIAPREGALAAIDRATGALIWLYEPPRRGENELYGFAAAPALSETHVFAADLSGNVHAFPQPRR